ncbi:MAG: hypothetical protein VX990_02795 [Pseudomonadota bacterium]|nr:hypothetical protein [Pseudomonadota bacterium]
MATSVILVLVLILGWRLMCPAAAFLIFYGGYIRIQATIVSEVMASLS